MRRDAWTKDRDAELTKLWPRPDLVIREIAEMLGVTHASASCRAGHLKLPLRPIIRRTGARSSDWADEHIAELRTLWNLKRSCRDIAKLLNAKFCTSYTKSSIIGKIHRLGLSSTRPKPSSPSKPRTKQRNPDRRLPKPPTPRSDVRVDLMVQRAQQAPRPLPESPDITALHAKPWLQREFGECTWIVEGEGADAISCCAPVHKRGWCRSHARIGIQPSNKRKGEFNKYRAAA